MLLTLDMLYDELFMERWDLSMLKTSFIFRIIDDII